MTSENKTVPYDAEEHGDGYSQMVPMHVVPKGVVEILVWRHGNPVCKPYRFNAGKVECRLNDEWVSRLNDEWVRSTICHVVDGWTLKATKPSPPKSYAAYLDEDGRGFLIGGAIYQRRGSDQRYLCPASLAAKPERALALIDFIQDALAEGEG